MEANMHRGKTMGKHRENINYKPRNAHGYQKLGERHETDPHSPQKELLAFKIVRRYITVCGT